MILTPIRHRYAANSPDFGSLHEFQSEGIPKPKSAPARTGFTPITVTRLRKGVPTQTQLHIKAAPGRLSIGEGKRLDEYSTDVDRTATGHRISVLSDKERDAALAEGRAPEPYVVHVDKNGNATCNCKGFAGGTFNSATGEKAQGFGYCRHADAIAGLLKQGKIKPEDLAKPGLKVPPVNTGKKDLKTTALHPLLQGTRLGYQLLQLRAKYSNDATMSHLLNRAMKGDASNHDVYADIGARLAANGDEASRAYRWQHMAKGLDLDNFTDSAVKKIVKAKEGSKVDESNFYDNVLKHLLPTHTSEITDARGRKHQSQVTAHFADSKLIAQALQNANPQQKAFWERLTKTVRSQMGEIGRRAPSDVDIIRSLVRHYYRETDRKELAENRKTKTNPADPGWKTIFGQQPWRAGDHRRPGNPERFRRRYAHYGMRHVDFLNHISEHPNDATSKLVYADWLEEQGMDQLANMWREQAEQPNAEGLLYDPMVEGVLGGPYSAHAYSSSYGSRKDGWHAIHALPLSRHVRPILQNNGVPNGLHVSVDNHSSSQPITLAQKVFRDPEEISKLHEEMQQFAGDAASKQDVQEQIGRQAHYLSGMPRQMSRRSQHIVLRYSDPFWDEPTGKTAGGGDLLEKEALARAAKANENLKPGQVPKPVAPPPPAPATSGARFGVKPGQVSPPPPPISAKASSVVQPQQMGFADTIAQLKKFGQVHIANYRPHTNNVHFVIAKWLAQNPHYFIHHVHGADGMPVDSFIAGSPDEARALAIRSGFKKMQRRSGLTTESQRAQRKANGKVKS